MNNFEKWDKLNEWWFWWLLEQLKNSLKKNNDKKKQIDEENEVVSKKKELLTLEDEILNKYEEYEKRLKEKEEEKKLPYFKTALKKLKWTINQSKSDLDYLKPQLEIYKYGQEKFDKLENKYGREKILILIENMVASWLQPRRSDEKWSADKWRVDSILELYDWTPDIIAQLLF